MTYPPTPDQSGQGGFQYDPYGSQPGSQPPMPGGSPQPQQPGYGQPSQPPAAPGYGPAPQLPPAAPGYPPPYGAPMMMGPQLPKGLSIASMVLGIIGVVFLCVPSAGGFIGLICGILAAIMGGVGLKRVNAGTGGGKGQAITGLVLGLIVCGLAVISIIALLAFGAAMMGGASTV